MKRTRNESEILLLNLNRPAEVRELMQNNNYKVLQIENIGYDVAAAEVITKPDDSNARYTLEIELGYYKRLYNDLYKSVSRADYIMRNGRVLRCTFPKSQFFKICKEHSETRLPTPIGIENPVILSIYPDILNNETIYEVIARSDIPDGYRV